jgi:hypothetical protein
VGWKEIGIDSETLRKNSGEVITTKVRGWNTAKENLRQMPMNNDKKIPTTSDEINEWLKRVDWVKFWNDVTEKSRPQIEAYHRASAASYAKAHEHWLL